MTLDLVVFLVLLLEELSLVKYDDLIGKPFKIGGVGPDYYDCGGLVYELSRRLGYTYPTFDHAIEYSLRDQEFNSYFSGWLEIQDFELYAIILFRHFSGYVNHIGMVIEPGKFIHTTRKTNVVVERLSQEHLCRISNIYRLQ